MTEKDVSEIMLKLERFIKEEFTATQTTYDIERALWFLYNRFNRKSLRVGGA